MKKLILILAALICMASNAQAIPSLQLDIGGGYYDNSSQTIIANSSSFTLYVLLNDAALLDQMFYLSAAVMPKTRTSADLGSFTFDGQQVEVTKDMVYGTPPIALADLDLQTHSIFKTFYTEFSFDFKNAKEVNPYNTQDTRWDSNYTPNGDGMYYVPFLVDISGLTNPNVSIHFDLYTQNLNGGLEFAPYSHDAQSGPPVPEPGTMLLLGTGLLGLVIYGKRRQNKC